MMVVKIHPFKRGPALTSSPGTQGRPKMTQDDPVAFFGRLYATLATVKAQAAGHAAFGPGLAKVA